MSLGEALADALGTPPLPLTDPPEAIGPESMPHEEHRRRLDRFVREHYAFVWRCARRLGAPQPDLDDIVQEVFLLAGRKLDAIHEERGYLFRACIYVVGHARRRTVRRREIVDDERVNAEIDGGATPEESAETAEARAQLQSILDAMPDDLRVVFVLFELERLTTIEIAELTGVPSGTVASRLRRAREIFMARIEEASRSER